MSKEKQLEKFKTLVKEVITPLLKRTGFKKKGNNYRREAKESIQIFNIQRMDHGGDHVTFACNLAVIIPEIHNEIRTELYKEKVPEPPTLEFYGNIRTGLERLAGCTWRSLENGVKYKNLSTQLQYDIQNLGLPWFEKNTTAFNLLDTLESQVNLYTPSFSDKTSLFLLYIKTQQLKKAEAHLNEWNSQVYISFDKEIKILAKKYGFKLNTFPKERKDTSANNKYT